MARLQRLLYGFDTGAPANACLMFLCVTKSHTIVWQMLCCVEEIGYNIFVCLAVELWRLVGGSWQPVSVSSFDSGGVPAVSSFAEVQGCCCTIGRDKQETMSINMWLFERFYMFGRQLNYDAPKNKTQSKDSERNSKT